MPLAAAAAVLPLLLLGTPGLRAEDLGGSGTWSVTPDPRETIAQTRAEERILLDEIAAFDAELRGITADMAALQERRAELEARQVTLQAELAAAEASLEEHRRVISGWVRALYRIHRQGVARILFGAESPHDLRRRGRYLLAIITADAQRFDDFKQAAARRREALQNVEAGLASIGGLNAELQLKEAELREQRSRKLEYREEILSRRQAALALQSELRRVDQGFGTANFDGSSPRYSGGGGSVPSFSDTSSSGGSFGMGGGGGSGGTATVSTQDCPEAQGNFREQYGKLPWPVSGQLLRRFGAYTDARTGRQESSKGLDIAARYGDPVYAVYGGIVDIASYLRGYGETVSVVHGVYTTVYTHLGGIQVRKGERVCPGDVLGSVGSSGLTDGEQDVLGFQIRYNNTPQDPLPWLKAP